MDEQDADRGAQTEDEVREEQVLLRRRTGLRHRGEANTNRGKDRQRQQRGEETECVYHAVIVADRYRGCGTVNGLGTEFCFAGTGAGSGPE